MHEIMRLIDAYNLLVNDGITDNHRYFSEVYKLYGFTDDKLLKEYLEFIDHEPVHWMRGFPAKLLTKLAFSKPKTALIKLLKKQSVTQALGVEYVTRIHDMVWNAFKQNVDKIVEERTGQVMKVEKEKEQEHTRQKEEEESVGSAESIETLETQPTPPLKPYRSFQQSEPDPVLHIEELHFPEYVQAQAQAQAQDKDRVDFLKDVLRKISVALPQGYADAFRLLISRV